MKLNLKFETKNTIKFLFIVILHLILFYFLIFKNLLTYFQIKEYIEVENLKSNRLKTENSELIISLRKKEEEYFQKIEEIKRFREKENGKLSFDKISDAFYKLNFFMKNRNILAESFGRIQKIDKNLVNISFSFKSDENNLFNFINDLENFDFYFNLTENYFKISAFENQLSARINIQFKINDNFEKININNEKTDIKLFFDENLKSNNSSFIRINNNIFYRTLKTSEKNEDDKQK